MLVKVNKESRVRPPTAREVDVFKKKAEKHFLGQRELQCGRDYRWNSYRHITADDRDSYRHNFDKIKWNSKKPYEKIGVSI